MSLLGGLDADLQPKRRRIMRNWQVIRKLSLPSAPFSSTNQAMGEAQKGPYRRAEDARTRIILTSIDDDEGDESDSVDDGDSTIE